MLEVWGARVHNLQNVDVHIPRDQLVVVTGLSGSGKSSLAFDTIFAEGQRRYMETLSAYARQFIGNMERPEVDKVNGLSPVISIEQKTTSRSPKRSTVGTVTEIYDFLRLLFARAGTAYSYETGEAMVQYSDEQIMQLLMESEANNKIQLLAPLVRARKGHYRELFEQVARQGYVRVRVDGQIVEISRGMKLDRYKTHDIELVIDRLQLSEGTEERLKKSLETAMSLGKGSVMVLSESRDEPRYFSRHLMCPTTGISYPGTRTKHLFLQFPKRRLLQLQRTRNGGPGRIEQGHSRSFPQHPERRDRTLGNLQEVMDLQSNRDHWGSFWIQLGHRHRRHPKRRHGGHSQRIEGIL